MVRLICLFLGLCPDWEDWDPKKAKENAKEAMDAAEKWLDVPQVRIGHQYMSRNDNDKRSHIPSIITCLCNILQFFTAVKTTIFR